MMVEVNKPERAPAAAPRVVLTATSDATSPRLAVLIFKVDPGLKPYHPNQSPNVPRNYEKAISSIHWVPGQKHTKKQRVIRKYIIWSNHCYSLEV